MLLAAIFLLCRDYDRLKAVLWPPAGRPAPEGSPFTRLEVSGYALGTAAGLVVFGGTRGFVGGPMVMVSLGLGGIAVLMVLTAWIRAARPGPRSVRTG